jgi:hypothetical protein
MSKHNNHYRQLVVRVFVVCCLLSAVILVWTQQYEYEEERQHHRHHISNSDKSAFMSWWTGGDASDSDPYGEPGTFSCKIHKMNMTLPQAPDLIIAGAPKCGTTTLAHWLLDHPSVLATKKWECHFFSTGIHPREFGLLLNITTPYTQKDDALDTASRSDLICQLRKRYLRHWPDLIASISGTDANGILDKGDDLRYFTFDKTPDYLYPSRVPALIRALFGPKRLPKVLVLLRNTIDRAYSHYRMTQRLMREEHIPFEEFITRELHLLQELGLTDFQAEFDREPTTEQVQEAAATVATDRSFSLEEKDDLYDQVSDQLQGHNYLSRGLYAMQLERWFRLGFGEELLIIPYNELSQDPEGVYARILDFVGMPDHTLDSNVLNKKFNYNHEKQAPLKNSTRLWLQQFYHEANEDLAVLLEEHNRTLDYQWRGMWGK